MIMNMNIWNDFEMENLFIGMLITLFLAIIIAATAILVFKSQQRENYPIKEDEGIVFLVFLLNIAQLFLIMSMYYWLLYLKLFFKTYSIIGGRFSKWKLRKFLENIINELLFWFQDQKLWLILQKHFVNEWSS